MVELDCPRPAAPERQFYWTLPVVGGREAIKASTKQRGMGAAGGANKILVPVCGRVTDPFVIRGWPRHGQSDTKKPERHGTKRVG